MSRLAIRLCRAAQIAQIANRFRRECLIHLSRDGSPASLQKRSRLGRSRLGRSTYQFDAMQGTGIMDGYMKWPPNTKRRQMQHPQEAGLQTTQKPGTIGELKLSSNRHVCAYSDFCLGFAVLTSPPRSHCRRGSARSSRLVCSRPAQRPHCQ